MFGIDVSHHQGRIDWEKVAQNNQKIDFTYIKTSTGVGSSDDRALYNAVNAKKNGIKIGYYHYCSLNNKDEIEDAKAEAKWFIQVLKSLPFPDLPVVLDLEDENPDVPLQDIEVLNWVNTFFTQLQYAGLRDFALYSYQPFLDTHLPADHNLGNIKLWIAQYRDSLTLPRGWNNYWLWQYSAKGHINGISTEVDLNKS